MADKTDRMPRCTPSSLSGCRGDTVHVPGCRYAVVVDEADLRAEMIAALPGVYPWGDAVDALLAGPLQRLVEQAAEVDCGHHSWAGLMALLDEHWPADLFPTRADDPGRDAGARIVSLLRWVDRLQQQSTGEDAACR